MHARTTWILLLLIAVLGGTAWKMAEREEPQAAPLTQLFPDLVPSQVQAVRLLNLTRDLHLELRRDDEFVWRIVDPIDYPAEVSMSEQLVRDLRNAPAVDYAIQDPERLGFVPTPRMVLEVVGGTADDPERVTRVELGEVSLDENAVFVRKDGHIYRTIRNLETALARPVHEWRNQRLLPKAPDPSAITEIHRRVQPREVVGPVPQVASNMEDLLDAGSDLNFDAILGSAGWELTAPFRAQLDPAVFHSLFVTAPVRLRVQRFEGDDPDAIRRFGIEQSELSLEWVTARGLKTQLSFARSNSSATTLGGGSLSGGQWMGFRQGALSVWSVDPGQVQPLALPIEDWVDRKLVRVLRDSVSRVEFKRPKPWGELVLQRTESGFSVGSAEVQGAAERVSDLLGALERLELGELRRVGDGFTWPAEPDYEVWFHSYDQRFGGEFADRDGALWLRRPGSDVALRAPEELRGLLQTSAAELVSRSLHSVTEEQVESIRVWPSGTQTSEDSDEPLAAGSDGSANPDLEFVRDTRRGRWYPAGDTTPAPDFELLVDRLRVLTVQDYLEQDSQQQEVGSGSSIRVSLKLVDGQFVEFELGRFERSGGQAPPGDGWVRSIRGSSGGEAVGILDGKLFRELEVLLDQS